VFEYQAIWFHIPEIHNLNLCPRDDLKTKKKKKSSEDQTQHEELILLGSDLTKLNYIL
jgi:hypothetical protein